MIRLTNDLVGFSNHPSNRPLTKEAQVAEYEGSNDERTQRLSERSPVLG